MPVPISRAVAVDVVVVDVLLELIAEESEKRKKNVPHVNQMKMKMRREKH